MLKNVYKYECFLNVHGDTAQYIRDEELFTLFIFGGDFKCSHRFEYFIDNQDDVK